MLKGEYVFLRTQKNEGISSKTGAHYLFCTLELSDGLESFALELKPDVYGLIANKYHKGDKVVVVVDIDKRYGRTIFVVSDVLDASKSAKVG